MCHEVWAKIGCFSGPEGTAEPERVQVEYLGFVSTELPALPRSANSVGQ